MSLVNIKHHCFCIYTDDICRIGKSYSNEISKCLNYHMMYGVDYNIIICETDKKDELELKLMMHFRNIDRMREDDDIVIRPTITDIINITKIMLKYNDNLILTDYKHLKKHDEDIQKKYDSDSDMEIPSSKGKTICEAVKKDGYKCDKQATSTTKDMRGKTIHVCGTHFNSLNMERDKHKSSSRSIS